MSVAVVARELEQLERGDEQEVLVKARRIVEPCENDEIGGRGRPKARRSNIHSGAEASLVNDHRLDLKSYNPPAVEVQDGHLGSLEVWKRAKHVQARGLGQAAHHFRLAKRTHVTSPLRAKTRESFLQTSQWSSEALSQSFERNEPRQPPRIRARPHSELRRVDGLALVACQIGQTSEIGRRRDEERGS